MPSLTSWRRIVSRPWRCIAILTFLRHIFFLPPLYGHAKTTEPVFIPTGTSDVGGRIQNALPIHTAMEAALALNSVPFMEMLSGRKNSANVKTFTQAVEQRSRDLFREEKRSAAKRLESSMDSWNFVRRLFSSANRDIPSTKDALQPQKHDCTATPPPSQRWMSHPSPCPSHETVAEYIGRLWFLTNNNNNNNGIRFRETIKILSLSHDGTSATVECHTEYYNGSTWVSCCRIICQFLSTQGVDSGVNMTLDCELLVWLPLPGSAGRAVRRKIGSVFESVAMDFFEERARRSRRFVG